MSQDFSIDELSDAIPVRDDLNASDIFLNLAYKMYEYESNDEISDQLMALGDFSISIDQFIRKQLTEEEFLSEAMDFVYLYVKQEKEADAAKTGIRL